MNPRRFFATLFLPMAIAACAAPPKDDLLERFEAALLAQDSATAALEGWCATRGLANPATIRAEPVAGQQLPPTRRNRLMLEVEAGEEVGYRHVRLTCGGKVLSQAHNWYVPARLTPDMNRQLETGDTPFGRVIAPLNFTRERLSGTRGGIEECPDGTVLHHHAVLRLPDGRPVSTVIECYTADNLR